MKDMHKLRQNEEFADVTLQSGDVQIRCHRIVLAVATDYFKAMFRCGLQESTLATVQLTMEPEILTSIVDYMYTGEIELTIGNVERLVKAGDVLQLDGLRAGCDEFMVTQVELRNCVEFYRFAKLYQLDKLHRNAKQLMLAEFKAIAFNAEFKEFSCCDLIEFIKEDELIAENEDVVCESVLDWVRHDLANRKASLETILEHVRLPYCTSNYLWHMKDTRDVLTPKCFEYLHEAMAFQADPVHKHEITSCRTLPRINFRLKSCLLVVGGLIPSYNSFDEYNCCQYYKEDTDCWESLTDPSPFVGRLYSVSYMDGGLLMIGGQKGGITTCKCWLFDLATKKFKSMPPLNTARRNHRSVSLGKCIYVVGGMDVDKEMLASVECLDTKRQQWLFIPAMPQTAWKPMVCTYSNMIFVFGGGDAQDKAQVYDTTRGQWSILSDIHKACNRSAAAVTLNDFIYVVGGNNRACFKYDPATDRWTCLTGPRQKHSYAPAVVWRGSILVAGGDDAKEKSTAIEQYDPLTDTWSYCSIAPLKEMLSRHIMMNVDLHDM
ncbi:Kelch-like protein 38 [Lamellibrachia satsuma]|nr:Kelch-like protein 38 [Lamellibrachia satsuma]